LKLKFRQTQQKEYINGEAVRKGSTTSEGFEPLVGLDLLPD
jgi:hypothetical protein